MAEMRMSDRTGLTFVKTGYSVDGRCVTATRINDGMSGLHFRKERWEEMEIVEPEHKPVMTGKGLYEKWVKVSEMSAHTWENLLPEHREGWIALATAINEGWVG